MANNATDQKTIVLEPVNPGDVLVTSVRVTVNDFGHDRIAIWNHHGKTGELTVTLGDGLKIARRLLQLPEPEDA